MRTDSIVRQPRGVGVLVLVFVLAGLTSLSSGCLARRSIVVDDLLEPLAPPRPWLPAPADLAAARLARAALVANSVDETDDGATLDDGAPAAVEKALGELEKVGLPDDQENLRLLAIDLRNATLDDPIRDREASRKLRQRHDPDPRLRGRLDDLIAADPLAQANRREFDGWHRLWARTFNTVSEPLGSSIITGFVLAPYQLANSVIHYLADFSNDEPLSLTDRQALALRRDFLRAHPDTESTAILEKKIERDSIRLVETLALRRTRSAEAALDADESGLAFHHAKAARTLLARYPEENRRLQKRAARLEDRARRMRTSETRRRLRSLEASPGRDESRAAETRMSRALLVLPPGSDELEAEISRYERAVGKPGQGRSEFLRALSQHEVGFDSPAIDRLTRLASRNPANEPMARHARALVENDWQNPYGAFERLERSAVRRELAWRLAGEWVRRTRYPNLPTPIAYLVDAPTIAITILLAPLRALTAPWTGAPDFRRAPALAAYRYLARFPDGVHQRELVEWLFDYESDRERWGRALRLADLMPRFDPEERRKLVEKTAEARLARIDGLDRRDNRASLLQGIAREFPDSEKGREAGLRARAEREDASPQHIRITRSFLIENPKVAGREGIGLNPRLLNGDPGDGELHPDGVLLRGGRVLEVLLIADGSDDEDPPEARQRKISKTRLARIAASLDDVVRRNGMIDTGARHRPDASRDVYLERANLGLTEDVDARPTAESGFVYRSLRERYGIVRGRDSILPFDLVFRGSLGDFTLGAFPRWRPPRETPDAFLYR